MSKIIRSLMKQKSIFVTAMSVLLIWFIAYSFSIGFMSHQALLSGISAWFSHYQTMFIFWHFLILTAIYFGWDMKVKRVGKQNTLSPESLKKARHVKWVLISGVLFVDLIVILLKV